MVHSLEAAATWWPKLSPPALHEQPLIARSSLLWRAATLATVIAALATPGLAEARRGDRPAVGTIERSRLPAEAQRTVELVLRGGPFPYRRDGVVFENREHRLPPRARGYYREYTVPTPGPA